MHFLRQKNKPTEVIAFMAILSALVAVLSLLSAFFPLGALFITLLVPLASLLVALLCPLPYVPVFVITAFVVSMGASFWNFQTTIFYVLPALIIGASYGTFEKLGAPSVYNLFFNTIIEMILFALSALLIQGIYGTNIIDILLTIIGKEESLFAHYVLPLFFFGYSLCQTLLAYLVYQIAFQRLKYVENQSMYPVFLPYAIGLVCLVGTLVFLFVLPQLAYFFFGALSYWAIMTSIETFPYVKKWLYGLMGALLFVGLLVFAGLYQLMPQATALLLTSVPFGMLLLTNFINVALKRRNSPTTM